MHKVSQVLFLLQWATPPLLSAYHTILHHSMYVCNNSSSRAEQLVLPKNHLAQSTRYFLSDCFALRWPVKEINGVWSGWIRAAVIDTTINKSFSFFSSPPLGNLTLNGGSGEAKNFLWLSYRKGNAPSSTTDMKAVKIIPHVGKLKHVSRESENVKRQFSIF